MRPFATITQAVSWIWRSHFQHPRCCTRFFPLSLPPSYFSLILLLTKMPPVPRTAGSAFPLLLWQFTWSYMAGDSTLCRPLIGPPLGMCVFLFMHACICVCMCVCVFQVLISIHRPCTEWAHTVWGIEGGKERWTDGGWRWRKKKSFHCSGFFAPNWKGLTNRGQGSFPLIWEKQWQEWCCRPFIALFLLFLFKIA